MVIPMVDEMKNMKVGQNGNSYGGWNENYKNGIFMSDGMVYKKGKGQHGRLNAVLNVLLDNLKISMKCLTAN